MVKSIETVLRQEQKKNQQTGWNSDFATNQRLSQQLNAPNLDKGMDDLEMTVDVL